MAPSGKLRAVAREVLRAAARTGVNPGLATARAESQAAGAIPCRSSGTPGSSGAAGFLAWKHTFEVGKE